MADAPIRSPFRELLDLVRKHRDAIMKQPDGPLGFCRAMLAEQPGEGLVADACRLLAKLDSDMQDYAISSSYARLIGNERRKALSAYFTPPALTLATLDAIEEFIDPLTPLRVIDPACGGGSFLVPIARRIIERRIMAGEEAAAAAQSVIAQMRGIEIEPGLARLSAALVQRMVARQWGVTVEVDTLVLCADALTAIMPADFDLAIGNPPYSKVWREGAEEVREIAGRADLGGHTNRYGLFVLRALDWLNPGGGLAFVLPTSFVAGPYFAGLREEILDRAEVVRLDLHQQREDLFLDATQDVCLLVLRRHRANMVAEPRPYSLGVIDAEGRRTNLGTADTPSGGEPWSLPVPHSRDAQPGHHRLVSDQPAATIADYGYRMRVGKVVPTRERARLHSDEQPGRLPVLWASDVRPDGSFEFQGGTRTASAAWYAPLDAERVPYASFGRSVLVQRTSNRDQQRRLNAAPVTQAFANKHNRHGYVAENHVIVIEPIPDKIVVEPDLLAALLNSAIINTRFSAVSGSFSVSARLLARLALPPAAALPRNTDGLEASLAQLFAGIDGILVPKPKVVKKAASGEDEAAQPVPPVAAARSRTTSK